MGKRINGGSLEKLARPTAFKPQLRIIHTLFYLPKRVRYEHLWISLFIYNAREDITL